MVAVENINYPAKRGKISRFSIKFPVKRSPDAEVGGKTGVGQRERLMGTKSTKTDRSNRKPTTKKVSALALCPTNGAGWCSFPFSPAQLEKRRKQVETRTEERQVVKARSGK